MAKWDWMRPHINSDYSNKDEVENLHHIFPTSRWWADIEQNKIRLFETLHQARHRVFWNATPTEVIRQTISVQKKALSEEFQKEMYYLLESEDPDWYCKDWVRLNKKWSVKR
jgi:hypothetical protein